MDRRVVLEVSARGRNHDDSERSDERPDIPRVAEVQHQLYELTERAGREE